jgi:hypothetical protein
VIDKLKGSLLNLNKDELNAVEMLGLLKEEL